MSVVVENGKKPTCLYLGVKYFLEALEESETDILCFVWLALPQRIQNSTANMSTEYIKHEANV